MVWRPITVSFTETDEEYVRKLAGGKDYTNVSDVVRDAIRCLRRERNEDNYKKNDLKQASGEPSSCSSAQEV